MITRSREDVTMIDIGALEGLSVEAAFEIDPIVQGSRAAEVKPVERLMATHAEQLPTDLRPADQPLGLFVDFGGATSKEGPRRVVTGHMSSASLRLRVHQ